MTARWTQRNARWTWLAGVAALLSVDQLSKSYFSTTLELGEAIKVTEWFNFVHALNPGAAFSFLAAAGRWLGALVVGGGGGNLVDRVQIGAVVDFLDFHWGSIHWPAFNLADVFIVCSVLVWCLASIKSPPRPSPSKTPEEFPS